MKQVDDLPAHAIEAMQCLFPICEELFPSVKREEITRTFVNNYFKYDALFKALDGKTCGHQNRQYRGGYSIECLDCGEIFEQEHDMEDNR